MDTPDGLLVPVIRDVDRKSLLQLAAEAAELADKARNKKLSADAMQGACFTISSLGHIGGTGFTPIVNAPEVAILGVSKATMQPVWDGKAFQPRLMLPLSLSYDHRVINGAAAALHQAPGRAAGGHPHPAPVIPAPLPTERPAASMPRSSLGPTGWWGFCPPDTSAKLRPVVPPANATGPTGASSARTMTGARRQPSR